MSSAQQSIVITLPGALAAGSSPTNSEWVRLPGTGKREPHTGLSRTTIWRLIKAGMVESKLLKNPLNPTAVRGTRLVRLASLLKAIEAAEAGTEPKAAG